MHPVNHFILQLGTLLVTLEETKERHVTGAA